MALWSRVTRVKSAATVCQNGALARAKRAEVCARKGEYSRAMSGLQAADRAPSDEKTCELLKQKHPTALHTLLGLPAISDLPPAKDIPESIVHSSLLSFKKGTSSGALGMRSQHLLDAINGAPGIPVISRITAVINYLQHGRVPVFMAPFFAGASLSALDTV